MRNKKAMSEIVTTIIMVVLALVAVAVIWQIINNLISDKGTQIATTQKCLDVKLTVSDVSGCTADGCNVTVTRSAGGDELDGVQIVLKTLTDSSKPIAVVGNIEQLETKTLLANLTAGDVLDGTPNKVEVTAYFRDDSGVIQNCPGKAEFNF